MHAARILCDSITRQGERLTTFEVVFPRIILAEFNTHCMLARNSASSRAIPIAKMLRMVQENPYVPERFGKNQKGMSSAEYLTGMDADNARTEWLQARDNAVFQVKKLLDLEVHKQYANRLLEPFMWHTVITSATDWSNYFHLRAHPAAHPDIQKVSRLMVDAYENGSPIELATHEWHVPLFGGVDDEPEGTTSNDPMDWVHARKVSAGRCARVSYLTHDGRRDPQEDVTLHDRLMSAGHMSPFEHVARPLSLNERTQLRTYRITTEDHHQVTWRNPASLGAEIIVSQPGEPREVSKVVHVEQLHYCAKFNGWMQYRKILPYEHDVYSDPRRDEQ